MKQFVTFILAALILAPLSFGISRSGNGTREIESRIQGYVLTPPVSFTSLEETGSDSFRISSNAVQFAIEGHNSISVEVSPLANLYPELSDLSPQAVDWMAKGDGFNELKTSEPCAKTYVAHSKTATTLLMRWGPKKGIAILAPLSKASDLAVLEMANSVKLLPGACGWKP